MDRYKKSLEYLERATKVTPGGAQTLSKMASRFPEGAYPVAASYGYGATLRDIDGNNYVDWICGLGAITLGYANPYVTSILEKEVNCGVTMSLPSSWEAEVAERLCQKIPCAEMVRFVNSGSEATEAAIRTARIATGRDMILTIKNGYHGWYSWFQAVKDWHPGIPDHYGKMIDCFYYNDWKYFDERMFDADNIAAVIMEPTLFEAPKDGWLQHIREECTRKGVLLIFDEVVCGGRWAYGGGQEYFGVTPDLATFGKGLANGLPIGILCGKRDYMRHAELVSGTFGGNSLCLAAVNAVMDVYEKEEVIGTMWKRGKELQDVFNNEAQVWSVPAICNGYPCKPRIQFKFLDPNTNDQAMTLFLQVCAELGVLFHPGGFNVCAALTDQDMDQSFKAIQAALGQIHLAMRLRDWSAIKGKLIQPIKTVRS